MSVKDGGPAFPRPLSKLTDKECSSDQEGMSLRDYFAGRAMQALIAREPVDRKVDERYIAGFDEHDLSRTAYQFADAMLAEREKGRG